MKKTLIAVFAIVALIGSAAFQTVTGQDTAAYLVMIANQGTQITNQLTALTRMTAHIDQLTGQFEHLKESALGQIGAITDPIADLVAVPTDLLNTTRDWHSDFTGPAGSLVTALTELSDGTSLSESWRDVLQEADTVTAADIRNVYPGSADRQRWPSFSAGATTPIAALSWHMRGPMPRPHLRRLRLRSRTRSTP